MRKFAALFLVVVAHLCWATAPTISGISCSAGSCTISGNNFGTKSNGAAPFYFNTFAGIADGTSATNAAVGLSQLGSTPSYVPVVSSVRAHSISGKSLKLDYPTSIGSIFPGTGLDMPVGSKDIYYANWVYWEKTTNGSTGDPKIFKWSRGGSNNGGAYSGKPSYYATIRPDDSGVVGTGTGPHDCSAGAAAADAGWNPAVGSTCWDDNIVGAPNANGWHWCEWFFRLSNPAGAANGFYIWSCDGKNNSNLTSQTTLATGETYTIDWMMTVFDGFDQYGTANAFRMYASDMVVEPVFNRVIITNNATYSSSTKFAYQPATSWGNTSLAVTFNQSDFSNGDTAYVFVANSNNEVNSTGFSFTINTGTNTGISGTSATYSFSGGSGSIAATANKSISGTAGAASFTGQNGLIQAVKIPPGVNVYDATGFTGKPDLTAYYIQPMLVIYEGSLAVDSDPVLHAKFAQAAITNPGMPWVLDVESIQPIVNGVVNSANINRLIHIITIAKSESNGEPVAYSDLAPKYTNAYDSDPDWINFIAAHDFFAPNLYADPTTTQASFKITADALKARCALFPTKPVYPFMWMYVATAGIIPVDNALWDYQINYTAQNFSNMVIWGGYDHTTDHPLSNPLAWDNSAQWWTTVKEVLSFNATGIQGSVFLQTYRGKTAKNGINTSGSTYVPYSRRTQRR